MNSSEYAAAKAERENLRAIRATTAVGDFDPKI